MHQENGLRHRNAASCFVVPDYDNKVEDAVEKLTADTL
jgi:hypothetical protein